MEENLSLPKRAQEAWASRVVRWQVAHEQRVTARRNVQAGGYTDGTPMAEEDRDLYRRLTRAATVVIISLAVLVGALITLAVVGK